MIGRDSIRMPSLRAAAPFRSALLCAALMAAALAAQSARAALHATEEFVSGKTRPVKIALLPVHVELQKQKMIRREAEVHEGGELEEYLANSVEHELSSRGYEVKRITSDIINADPKLQELVIDADRRYGELLTQVSVKLARQVAQRRYKAGDEMKLLAARLGVDAIAFTRMQMIAAGKGVQVLNFGMGGTQTMLSVSLIDGATADIEAYLTLPIMKRGQAFGGYEDIMKDPDHEMGRLAAAVFDEMPNADPSLRAARPAGGDVVKDVESLLGQ
ncbi:MAG TPA: hypothetical protein VFV10_10590 [Gammaproteobacteria bacterium]|nr:hypothetical protein [Gammaproteobacteria bacterium]